METNREHDECTCDSSCQRQGCSQGDGKHCSTGAEQEPALSTKAVMRISEDIRLMPAPRNGKAPSRRPRPATQQEAIALLAETAAGSRPAREVALARVLCAELVDLAWTGMDGCREQCTANLEEIWRTGATLDLEQPLSDGAMIVIHHECADFKARVLYCQQNLTGYSAGVVFDATTPWEPARFLPAHALQFRHAAVADDEEIPLEQGSWRDGKDRTNEDIQRDRSAMPMRQLTLEGLSPLISSGSLARLGNRLAEE